MAHGIEMRPLTKNEKRVLIIYRRVSPKLGIEYIAEIKEDIKNKINAINPLGVKTKMDIWKLQQELKYLEFYESELNHLIDN